MIKGPLTENREHAEIVFTARELFPGSSESKRQKAAETLLNILEGRSAYMSAWHSFFKFCSESRLELDRVKPYHFGATPGAWPPNGSTWPGRDLFLITRLSLRLLDLRADAHGKS